jgi:hypothetical protein
MEGSRHLKLIGHYGIWLTATKEVASGHPLEDVTFALHCMLNLFALQIIELDANFKEGRALIYNFLYSLNNRSHNHHVCLLFVLCNCRDYCSGLENQDYDCRDPSR